jgi:hypothetical protein
VLGCVWTIVFPQHAVRVALLHITISYQFQ